MRRLFLALAVLTTSTAFAQFDDDDAPPVVNVQVPGMSVQINTGRQQQRGPPPAAPAPQPGRMQPPPRAVGGENFSAEYGPMNGVPAASLKIVSPEAALAEVWAEDGSLAGSFSVPFIFTGRSGQYYRVILSAANGDLILDKKFEIKQFIGALIKMRGAPAPAPMPVPQPMPMPVAQGMAGSDFADLLKAIDDASFSKEKLSVIELAAKDHLFTVEQVGQVVDALSFSADKIGAVELTRRRLVDPKNSFKLLEHFTFSTDKEKVQKLLK